MVAGLQVAAGDFYRVGNEVVMKSVGYPVLSVCLGLILHIVDVTIVGSSVRS